MTRRASTADAQRVLPMPESARLFGHPPDHVLALCKIRAHRKGGRISPYRLIVCSLLCRKGCRLEYAEQSRPRESARLDSNQRPPGIHHGALTSLSYGDALI